MTPDELQSMLQNLIESGNLTKEDAATLMQAANDPAAMELMLSKLKEAGAGDIGSPPLDINQFYRDGTDMFELRWPIQASLPISFDQLDRKTQFFVLFQEWSRRELSGSVALNAGQIEEATSIFEECLARAQQLQVGELVARSYEGLMRVAERISDRKAASKWSKLAMKARAEDG